MQTKQERGDYKTRAYFLMKEELRRANGAHRSAEEIHQDLCRRGEHIGLTTVYRQLKRLVEEGYARKSAADGVRGCYSLQGENCAEHYHLVCTECGMLSHVCCEQIEDVIHHVENEHHFTIMPAKTTLYGLCAKCMTKSRKEVL